MTAAASPNRRAVPLLLLALALLLLAALWRWQTAAPRAPRVLYLSEDAAGVTQLFEIDLRGREPRPWTQQPDAVTGFALSPDGARLAFTTSPRADAIGQETIWLAAAAGAAPRALLTCPDAVCHHLGWAPDSRRLIFERRDLAAGVPGPPHLWWLDADTGEALPVLQQDPPASGASLSPDGRWIAYVAAGEDVVQAYAFDDGDAFRVPSQIGVPPVWHPDGDRFLLPDLNIAGEAPDPDQAESAGEAAGSSGRHLDLGTHLFLVDVATAQRTLLSARLVVDDGNPAWSPDGAWIAFGRRQARTDAGRQLWLMRADGSAARPLTDEPLVQHGPPAWSPDGRFLLFQRFDLAQPDAEPGVWLLELETGGMRQLAAVGFLPAWLP